MPDLTANSLLMLITLASVFCLVLSLWIMGVLLWKARKDTLQEKLQHRLELLAHDSQEGRILRLWSEGREAVTVVPGSGRLPLMARLEHTRRLAGIDAGLPLVLMSASALVALLALITLAVTGSLLVTACAIIATLMICWIIVKQRIAKRMSVFEGQLVDALELAARSLRAGHPLQGAFRLISEEIPAPVGAVFADIVQEHALGVGLDDAIRTAARRSTSSDLQLFATSVIIQLRSGGNLADMMERLAAVIRDRIRLSRRVRVLTAQTQFSKRILLALPFVVFVLLNLLNPRYMAPLYTTPSGHTMLLVAAIGLLIGVWLMNRLAVVRY